LDSLLFYHEDNEFTGIIKKNENGSLEVNILNPIVISNDDFVLITGHVNGEKVSFVMYNHFIYIHSTEHTREVTYLIHSLFIGETYTNFDQLKFKNISLKINNNFVETLPKIFVWLCKCCIIHL